jgi:DNA-binding NarL/FixJ family response regulator
MAERDDTEKRSDARVVVAEDDVLLREGIASLLEREGFRVVGQAGDGRELVELVREHEPELVLVDIRMPPGFSTEGLEAAQTIRSEFPDIGILLLSAHVEVEHAMELLVGGSRSTASRGAVPSSIPRSCRSSLAPGAPRTPSPS